MEQGSIFSNLTIASDLISQLIDNSSKIDNTTNKMLYEKYSYCVNIICKKLSNFSIITMSHKIDSDKAKEIATRFLEQHYSILEVKQAVLEDEIWTVTVTLSSSDDKIRKVRIDAKTGKIIDWSK
jgi:uncharacterized membrane protein YkoI